MNKRVYLTNVLKVIGLISMSIFTSTCGLIEKPNTETAQLIMRTDGSILLFAPIDRASAQNPSFSPFDDSILFTVFINGYNQGPSGLYLIPFSTSATYKPVNPNPLFFVEGHDSVNLPGFNWNSVTNRIVFSSDTQGNDEIWTIEAQTKELSRITYHSTDAYFIEPSFSPDGAWIVFEANKIAPNEYQQGKLYKIRLGESHFIPLLNQPPANADDHQPNWSPRGDRILFQRRLLPQDDWDLYTVDTEGNTLTNITQNPNADDTDGSWSPNGACILYSSNQGNIPTPNIFVIPSTGGIPYQITNSDTHTDSAPSWSHDGRWIVFESKEGMNEDIGSSLWYLPVPEGLCD